MKPAESGPKMVAVVVEPERSVAGNAVAVGPAEGGRMGAVAVEPAQSWEDKDLQIGVRHCRWLA